MLAREKAVLGFYITKHPLAQHEQLLAACANATSAQLIKMTEGQKVIVGGMVSSVRTVTARTGRNAGKLLGIVTLEDLKGKVEAVLFPDDFLKFRSALTPDAIVFVEGEVDRKREEPSIRVSRVVPVDQVARDLAKALLIDVQADTSIERLVAVLRAFRGECRVYLNVATADGAVVQIECNPSLRVACTSELFAALGDLVPKHAARVVGPQRQQIPVHPTSRTAASARPVLV